MPENAHLLEAERLTKRFDIVHKLPDINRRLDEVCTRPPRPALIVVDEGVSSRERVQPRLQI